MGPGGSECGGTAYLFGCQSIQWPGEARLDSDLHSPLPLRRPLAPALAPPLPRPLALAGFECTSPLEIRYAPLRCVVFDSRPGGSGVTGAAFRNASAVFEAALLLTERCACADGCPLCIFDDGCRESNVVLDKRATVTILRAALECVKSSTTSDQALMPP